MSTLTDEKPKGNFRNELPKSISLTDEKPKGNMGGFVEGYETVNSVMTVGAYAGLPFLIYTVAGTVTFTQPRGGRAG